MPSPTSSTCPTARVSTRWSKLLIFSTRTLMISLESILVDIAVAPIEQECAERLEPGADGGVNHRVAHLDDQPAEQVRVHPYVEHRLAVENVFEAPGQRAPLGVRKRDGGRNLHPHAPVALVEQLAVRH